MSTALTQTLIALAIVLAAGTWLGLQGWRAVARARAKKSGGCDSGCGCGH